MDPRAPRLLAYLALALLQGQGSAPPGPSTFRDVARDVGLLVPNVCGSTKKDYIIEVNGSGAGWLDYDGDGDLDLWVANGSTLEALRGGSPGAGNTLYRNDRGRFTDVTVEAGAASSDFGCGVAAADFDGDGDPDVFVAELGPDRLFRNDGCGRFAECGHAAGVDDPRWGTSAVFFDADLDGDLDLYVANYLDFDLAHPKGPGGTCQWKGHPVMCGPQGLPPCAGAFFRNEGDGRFVEASAQAGLRAPASGYGLGVVAFDAEGDGDPDLYVANDSTPNFLFLNRGDGRFAEGGFLAGVALSSQGREQAGMGIGVGDADGNGLEDLLVTNFSGEPNAFYRNLGGGLFSDDAFPSGLGGPSVPLLGWGTALLDLDLDGDLDAITANGHVYPQAELPGSDSTYAQPLQVFENDGRGRFREVGAACGPDVVAPALRRAVAFGDYDEDGDLDLFVSVLGGAPQLLQSDPRGGAFLVVRLRGRRSNRDGTGAKVTVEAAGRKQVRFARGGYSFQSSNDPRVHFGLGGASRVDSVEILWPSGTVGRIEGVAPGSRLLGVEGEGLRVEARGGKGE
ncbi:MAG TPA: CRTAC1 family protein [Planctomycetota bacterium]|nr:CRTAC1 family protein [Planctomycetota bacterium]